MKGQLNIYLVDIGEVLTIAASSRLEAAILALKWHVNSTSEDDMWEFQLPKTIEVLPDEYKVTMVHPSEMTSSVEWLRAVITEPQVIGSTEY